MDHSIDYLNEFLSSDELDFIISTGEYSVNVQYENLLRAIDARLKGRDSFVGMIFVAGPSSSGKTTFSEMLRDKLGSTGINATVVSLDDFYHDKEYTKRKQVKMGLISEDSDDVDYETVEAFDVSQFKTKMRQYVRGEKVMLPEFDFLSGKQLKDRNPIKRKGKDILIIEGIQTMNPKVFNGISVDLKLKIYICPFDTYTSRSNPKIRITPQMIRFMRRTVRDNEKRGASVMRTCEMWPSVRLGEERYIKPMKKYADFFFNSSYMYEPFYLTSKIRKLIERLSDEEKAVVYRYIDEAAINSVLPKEKLAIPKDSVFNEFYFE
ncbi:MAG: hypothetical protein ILO53_06480 [Clostridia bacterium]|nr:hypothetical protein [Clostridia bacterium]